MVTADPSEAQVKITPKFGKWNIGPVVPSISNFTGGVTADFASTFDYLATFYCDAIGYRSNTPDLAWIELWAADHGGTDYFYCGKIKALEVPMSMASGPPFPTYAGSWKGLGQGRTYDLYVKYRLITGDESQLSAVVASGISNMGIGVTAMSANPSLSTAPDVTTFSGLTYFNNGDVYFGINFVLDLNQPANAQYIKDLVFYCVPTFYGSGDPNAETQIIASVAYNSGGSYNVTIPSIPASVPYNVGTGNNAYNLFVAYRDYQGNITTPAFLAQLEGNSLSSLLGATIFFSSGNGVPSGAPSPASVPAFYFNTGGSAGSLFYIWTGTAWNAIA